MADRIRRTVTTNDSRREADPYTDPQESRSGGRPVTDSADPYTRSAGSAGSSRKHMESGWSPDLVSFIKDWLAMWEPWEGSSDGEWRSDGWELVRGVRGIVPASTTSGEAYNMVEEIV